MRTAHVIAATTILGAGLFTGSAAGATTEADCSSWGAGVVTSQTFTVGDLTVNSLAALTGHVQAGDVIAFRFTLAPGCGLTPTGIVGHATASLSFDENETQPHLAETVAREGTFTVPQSTVPGMCRVQLDGVVGRNSDGSFGVPFIDKAHRYNEPLADRNGDGKADGTGTWRLLSAGYAEGGCVTAPTVPAPTTSTTAPAPTTTPTTAPDSGTTSSTTPSTTPTTSPPTTSTLVDIPPADSTTTTAPEGTPIKVEVGDPMPPDCATAPPGVPCITTEIPLTPAPTTSTTAATTTTTDGDTTLPYTGSSTGGLVKLAAWLAGPGAAMALAALGLRRRQAA